MNPKSQTEWNILGNLPGKNQTVIRRGLLSKAMRSLPVGKCLRCLPGVPRWPHQTVWYHNKSAQANNEPHRWQATVDNFGTWRIHRVQ